MDLMQKRTQAWEMAKVILDGCLFDNRGLTDEERSQYEIAMTALEACDRELNGNDTRPLTPARRAIGDRDAWLKEHPWAGMNFGGRTR